MAATFLFVDGHVGQFHIAAHTLGYDPSGITATDLMRRKVYTPSK